MVAIVQSRTQLDNAALLLLKVVAFGLMFGDHLDMLVGGSLGIHAGVGRVVFPVFAVVLGLNLARTEDWEGLLRRTAPRLAVIGLVSSPVYGYLLGWHAWNVMFTLAAAVVAIAFVLRGWWLAAAATIFAAGLSVDYGTFGVLAVVGVWMLARLGMPPVALAVWAAVAVMPVNGSVWSLGAIPLVLAVQGITGDAPRLKWLFWAGYPAHLVILAIAFGV